MPMAGYHTVKLTSPISLSAGQRFSVVVKYTTSTYRYPLVAEYALAGYSSKATASRGQSYISSNGISWTDLTTYKSTANICIKAFTSVVTNNPPQTPSQPQGPTSSKRGVTCSYTTSTTDPDGDIFQTCSEFIVLPVLKTMQPAFDLHILHCQVIQAGSYIV